MVFKSYRDGRQVSLTPESSVLAQKQLGADIIIPLVRHCLEPMLKAPGSKRLNLKYD